MSLNLVPLLIVIALLTWLVLFVLGYVLGQRRPKHYPQTETPASAQTDSPAAPGREQDPAFRNVPVLTRVQDRTFYWDGKHWKEIAQKHNAGFWRWLGKLVIALILLWIVSRGFNFYWFNFSQGLVLFASSLLILGLIFSRKETLALSESIWNKTVVQFFRWLARRKLSVT